MHYLNTFVVSDTTIARASKRNFARRNKTVLGPEQAETSLSKLRS
jgi:hypothetical protein